MATLRSPTDGEIVAAELDDIDDAEAPKRKAKPRKDKAAKP